MLEILHKKTEVIEEGTRIPITSNVELVITRVVSRNYETDEITRTIAEYDIHI